MAVESRKKKVKVPEVYDPGDAGAASRGSGWRR